MLGRAFKNYWIELAPFENAVFALEPSKRKVPTPIMRGLLAYSKNSASNTYTTGAIKKTIAAQPLRLVGIQLSSADGQELARHLPIMVSAHCLLRPPRPLTPVALFARPSPPTSSSNSVQHWHTHDPTLGTLFQREGECIYGTGVPVRMLFRFAILGSRRLLTLFPSLDSPAVRKVDRRSIRPAS